MSIEQEIPFTSGESNKEVVRVGNTVRRNLSDNSEFVHRVMQKLTSEGFELSPKFLGIDEKGREIITYIPGKQMNHGEITIDLAKQSMTALRRFHDLLSDEAFTGEDETVCHTDFAPWNLIVERRKLVGVVDFDDIEPGKRMKDVAYACWTLLELGSQNTDEHTKFVLDSLPILLNSYGNLNTDSFVPMLLSEQNRILELRQNKAEESSEHEKYQIAKVEEIKQQIEWVKNNSEKIEASLEKTK